MEKGFEPKSAGSTERFFNFLDGKASVLLIRRLPETYRKVMYMRYVQELSIKEMAVLTGQTKNAITVKAHRGLKKLKLLYESE
jgi:DNA-directed RNA polymerase specialized sigma24 family protein